jgi:hypothetical protein|tara:strand:- start:333 stop:611 length:279 start_codon:yes stop_codon:yes gene_type:complete
MIIKKIKRKSSFEWILTQGDRIFRFEEYFKDVWLDKKMYPKETKPFHKKGDTAFFYYMGNQGFGNMWSTVEYKPKIDNIKDAKSYVKNRKYL